MPDFTFPDYQHLGTDITVEPDLSEDEILVTGADCLIQDLIHLWTQPTGIADGTVEGAEWGVDLRSYLSTGQTQGGLFALKNSLEVQATRDDRVASCEVTLVLSNSKLLVQAVAYVGAQPYPFSFICSPSTVSDLLIERLPDGV